MQRVLSLVLVAACGGQSVPPASPDPDERRVVVTSTVVEILDDVRFDEADAMSPESVRSLDAVARSLNGNPSIRRLEVQVRLPADDALPAEREARAQHRAEIAVTYLVGREVDPARLTAKGYSDPIATSDASHVKLLILERSTPP